DMPNANTSEPFECWFDGISLTDAPSSSYVQAEPIEVGIAGPAPLSADLADVIGEDDTAVFLVELAANPFGNPPAPEDSPPPPITGPVGKLALDLLDGWDRVVWTRTNDVVMPRTGKYAEKVSLRLPRGYYRLLATLWSGEPGQSRIISHDERAAAVISFQDPVPLGNRFGLNASAGCISGYTTALGAGWVWLDLPAQRIETKAGLWDFAPWQADLKLARQFNVEVVAGLTLPVIERFRRPFFEQWLAANPIQPIGVMVSPPAISTRPVGEYVEQLRWVSELLAGASPPTRLVFDASALGNQAVPSAATQRPESANLVMGYASTEGALPERSEPLLEEIGRRHTPPMRVWDLGVPVRLSGPALPASPRPRVAASPRPHVPASVLEPPPDPVLAASRMVRAILIRALAGAQLVCCDATALAPPTSLYASDSVDAAARQALHERDLTPRPALVAFERMTSLLNDATLVRWIDQPGGARILLFEKDEGSAVAVAWRPFGLSPTYVSLAGLPSTVPILDCLGMPEPLLMEGNVRLLEVNEFVRYVVADAAQVRLLSEALDSARVRQVPPTSRPAS
ncbi:MAG: hypothetical protein HY718_04220, partial [Planctomycetes bacterium]|nr:hypothetical protein [Planctomycetota bacterium]